MIGTYIMCLRVSLVIGFPPFPTTAFGETYFQYLGKRVVIRRLGTNNLWLNPVKDLLAMSFRMVHLHLDCKNTVFSVGPIPPMQGGPKKNAWIKCTFLWLQPLPVIGQSPYYCCLYVSINATYICAVKDGFHI